MTQKEIETPAATETPNKPAASQAAPAAKTPDPAKANGRKPATIGPSIVIHGDVSGEEDLIVDGTVEGTVNFKDNNLVVSANGQVKANISARIIRIDGEVKGALWDFKRDGILPFERDSVPAGEREPVNEAAIEQMKGELIDEEVAVAVDVSEVTEEWEELSTPVEEEIVESNEEILPSLDDERASLEEELARLDARWERKTDPVEQSTPSDSTLQQLEDSLDGIDL